MLDPVLLDPEIVRHIHLPRRAHHANRVLRFIQQVCSSATPGALRVAAWQAVGGSGLERFARRWVERADVFPRPPFPTCPDAMPLKSAAQMIAAGRTFRNCLKDPNKIAEVLLGYAYQYMVEPRAEGDAEAERYVVELTPLSDGRWLVGTIGGVKGQTASVEAKAAVHACMLELGALAPTNPILHPEARALEATLGVFRHDPLECHDLDVEAGAAALL